MTYWICLCTHGRNPPREPQVLEQAQRLITYSLEHCETLLFVIFALSAPQHETESVQTPSPTCSVKIGMKDIPLQASP